MSTTDPTRRAGTMVGISTQMSDGTELPAQPFFRFPHADSNQPLQIEDQRWLNQETAERYPISVAVAVAPGAAERIVACWNACLGLENFHLEAAYKAANPVGPLLAAQLIETRNMLHEVLEAWRHDETAGAGIQGRGFEVYLRACALIDPELAEREAMAADQSRPLSNLAKDEHQLTRYHRVKKLPSNAFSDDKSRVKGAATDGSNA